MTETTDRCADPSEAGWAALASGEWSRAHGLFEQARAAGESAAILEGLGTAAFWLDDPRTIDIRERAYRLYREEGDGVGAARVAVALALDHVTFRGEEAVAQGWLELAGRLLDGLDVTPEHGWLSVWEGDFAISAENDPVKAARLAGRTIEIGRAVGVPDIELLGLAQQGVALVSQGHVTEGMRRLDASVTAAVAGEMSDVASAGYACCYLISACEQVRDLPRAAQWCHKLSDYCARVGFPTLLHLCRAHYAGVLVEQGDWVNAESEMLLATESLRARRPGMAVEGVVRLAELRRRQGRLREAAELFGAADPHPLSLLGRASLALDEGDPVTAAGYAQRYLRQFPVTDRTGRAGGLEALVDALVQLGDLAAAGRHSEELRQIADLVGTSSLKAVAALAQARVARAAGDLATARTAAEDAVDLYDRAGAPFGAAHARALLARLLDGLGERDAAAREATSAARAFDHLGASRDAELVRRAVPELPHPRSPLTRRESDVLRLVASGMSNADIAERLVLSRHTVHRHVANILTKLGVSTRTAAAARATSLGLL